MIAPMTDEQSDGFKCIGCGADVAEPDELERTTARGNDNNKRGFCALCLGGRAKKRAVDKAVEAAATQETQDD